MSLPKFIIKLSATHVGFFSDNSFRIYVESEIQRSTEIHGIVELTESFRSVMFSEASFTLAKVWPLPTLVRGYRFVCVCSLNCSANGSLF